MAAVDTTNYMQTVPFPSGIPEPTTVIIMAPTTEYAEQPTGSTQKESAFNTGLEGSS